MEPVFEYQWLFAIFSWIIGSLTERCACVKRLGVATELRIGSRSHSSVSKVGRFCNCSLTWTRLSPWLVVSPEIRTSSLLYISCNRLIVRICGYLLVANPSKRFIAKSVDWMRLDMSWAVEKRPMRTCSRFPPGSRRQLEIYHFASTVTCRAGWSR